MLFQRALARALIIFNFAGLLARKASETDKRQQIVFLTDKGKALEAEAAKIPNCMADLLGTSELDANKIASGMIPLLDELIEKLSAKA